MNHSLGYFDLPILLGCGFKFGIADNILWGKDTHNNEWQAVVEDEWILFAKRLPKGNTESLQRMGRNDFMTRFQRG